MTDTKEPIDLFLAALPSDIEARARLGNPPGGATLNALCYRGNTFAVKWYKVWPTYKMIGGEKIDGAHSVKVDETDLSKLRKALPGWGFEFIEGRR